MNYGPGSNMGVPGGGSSMMGGGMPPMNLAGPMGGDPLEQARMLSLLARMRSGSGGLGGMPSGMDMDPSMLAQLLMGPQGAVGPGMGPPSLGGGMGGGPQQSALMALLASGMMG